MDESVDGSAGAGVSTERVKTWEGVVTVPLAVNNQRAVRTDEGEYVYNLLQFDEGDRVRVTVERIAIPHRPTRSEQSLEGAAVNGLTPVGQEAS